MPPGHDRCAARRGRWCSARGCWRWRRRSGHARSGRSTLARSGRRCIAAAVTRIRQFLVGCHGAAVDQVVTPLQVGAAQEGVRIVGAVEHPIHVQQLRAQIHQIDRIQAPFDVAVVVEQLDGLDLMQQQPIRHQPQAIAHGGGTQQRQHQERSAVHAPFTQRLAEVGSSAGPVPSDSPDRTARRCPSVVLTTRRAVSPTPSLTLPCRN